MNNIINLTSYSAGLLTPEDILNHAIQKGLNSVVITEDSSLVSSIEINKKAAENNIKSIHGSLLSIKDKGKIAIYAKNQSGFTELSNILSELDRFKIGEKREIDFPVLLDHLRESNNLYVIDGFENSLFENSVLSGNFDDYKQFVKSGIELGYVANKNTEKPVRKAILEVSKKYKLPIYHSGISRYKNESDFNAWYALYQKAGDGRLKGSKKYSDFKNIYSLDNQENSASPVLTDGAYFSNNFENYKLRREVSFPKLYKEKNPLRNKVREIWLRKKKKIDPQKVKKYEKRIKEELDVIESLGENFEQYFMFYYSLARGARSKDYEVTIRGSAGGSLILHVLGLSKADPVENNLNFERFLFRGINDYPDIDLDVSNKDGCVNMLKENFGDFYAEIAVNKTLIKATSTIEVALSTYKEADIFTQAQIESFEKKVKEFERYLKKSGDKTKASYLIKNNHFWKKEYDQSEVFRVIVDDAIKLEGMSVGRPNSPSSSVLSNQYIKNISPVYNGLTELFSTNCEGQGLLKIDIISSKMLGRVNRVKSAIVDNWDKKDQDGNIIPLDDFISDHKNVENLFDYMSRGYTEGVNQIGGKIGKFICEDVKPSNFADLMVVLGLIRMGINENTTNYPEEYIKYKEGKNNPDSIQYIHDNLKPILSETYGSIIYEEQIMEIAKKIGGFDHNMANKFRKCITKQKDKDSLNGYFKDVFIEGGLKNGYDRNCLDQIFVQLENKINQFNFSKNHSANYAMIALSEMFLKYEYPAEFLQVYSQEKAKEDSVKTIKEEFDAVGYIVARPTCDNIFNDDFSRTRIVSGREIKVINSNIGDIVNKDFKNYYAENDFSVSNISSFVDKALPFYSSKTAFLINDEEKKSLYYNVENLIKVGVFDEMYDQEIKSKINIKDPVLRTLYTRSVLINNLDDVINSVIDKEPKESINYSKGINVKNADEVSNLKVDCIMQENKYLGSSPLRRVGNMYEAKRNTLQQ